MKFEDIKVLITKLSDKEAYVMMKFIYMSWKRIGAGFQKADKYCRSDILFKTHTLILQKLGQSSIGKLLLDPLKL